MNGWYFVYLLTIAANAVMCTAHGYNYRTWQLWVWFGIVVMSFIAGQYYGGL